MNATLPSWMSEKLSRIVVSTIKNRKGKASDAIDELCFQAAERLKLELKGIPPELKARLPVEFVKILEASNHTYLNPLETASLIILDEDSNAWLPSVVDEVSRLKAQGLSEYEATKTGGLAFTTSRIESLIELLSGGDYE